MIEEKEIWLPVIGYEGYYEVSNSGKIRSISKMIPFKNVLKFNRGRILRHGIVKGYCQIKVYRDGDKTNFYVHRLVGAHFKENPFNLPDINHEDGNKLNNNDWNLNWCTPKQNVQHAIRTGLRNQVGEKSAHKLITSEVLDIRRKYIPLIYTMDILATEYGVTKSCINSILSKKSWKHI